MKRPICIATIASIIGIIMGLYCQSIASFVCPFLGVSIFMLLLFQIYERNFNKNQSSASKAKTIILQFSSLFLAFLFIFLCYTIHLEKNYQTIYQNYDSQELEMKATVISNAQEKEYKNVYQIRVTQIDNQNIKSIKLLLQVKKEKDGMQLTVGQKISLKATYQKPEVARNEGGFDYSSYLKTKGMAGTISCSASNIAVLENKTTFSIEKILNDLKVTIKRNLNQLFPKDIARLSSRTHHWGKARN